MGRVSLDGLGDAVDALGVVQLRETVLVELAVLTSNSPGRLMNVSHIMPQWSC